MSQNSIIDLAPFAIEPDARRACRRARFELPNKASKAITATTTETRPPSCPRPPREDISDLNPPPPNDLPPGYDLTRVL